MRILGLDVSTYVGMALLTPDPEECKGKCVHVKGMTGIQRISTLMRAAEHTLDVWKPDVAVLEHYAFSNRNSLVTLVECGTIIRILLYQKSIPWYEVPPTALKKWTTGSGAADKPKMAEAVKQRWGYKSPSDDIVDAYALGKMLQENGSGITKIKGVVLAQ